MEITIEESRSHNFGAKIKVVGVGGGGGNMISHIINSGGTHPDIELILANTDAQALHASKATHKIQLGTKLTKGLGAGMRPDTGKEAALESYEDIKHLLEGADLVFIAAGLGGGTGTGAAPVIAQAAKDIGALTVSVVTKPFRFEGGRRSKLADQGLGELKKESDSIVVIPNDKLLSVIEKGLGIKDSFRIVDDVLGRAVNGMSGIILMHGENDINVDFADVKTVMSHRGLALMGIGESSGSNAAYDAIKSAVESPLFDNMSISGAMGVLVHFQMHPKYPLYEISDAMEIVEEAADAQADVIFGTTTNENMPEDSILVTIVATGFEKELIKPDSVNNGSGLLRLSSQDNLFSSEEKREKKVRMVSGGDYSGNEDILDVPTFIRRQMD